MWTGGIAMGQQRVATAFGALRQVNMYGARGLGKGVTSLKENPLGDRIAKEMIAWTVQAL